MEASEKPQLPLDGGAPGTPEGAVRLLEDRLVIDGLTVNDERAARVVRERAEGGQPPAETVRKAIEIGSRVLDTEETAANVDYVRHELGELDRRLAGTLEEGATELAERLAAVFGADRNDSVQAQIREIVGTEARNQRDALIQALTAEDGSNPLVAVQTRLGKAMLEAEERHRKEVERLREAHAKEARAMHGQVGELHKEIARLVEREEAERRVAEAEEAGTRKGRTFEERVHLALEAIAHGRGDAAQRVGDERGDGGGKKGDVVIEVGAADGSPLGRFVVEVKDERLSKNKAWQELNEAMRQREASFGVLAVAGEERIPAGREQLHEYEGNKMIVAVDRENPDALALEVAYRYARCRVMMSRERELTLDAAGVRNATEEAISALRKSQSIRLALTGATDSVDKARSGLDEMTDAVRERLDHIESLVAAADAAE